MAVSLHVAKPNTHPDHHVGSETSIANANKYHAEITASHARLAGGASIDDIRELLVAMQRDVTQRIDNMQRDVTKRIDNMHRDVTRMIRENRAAIGDLRTEQQRNTARLIRVEQMSAVVSHPFSSTIMHERSK